MGHTILLQVKRGGKATGGDRDDSIMLSMEKELDALASEMEIAPPGRFYDTWGDSAAGHQAITAILGMLRDQPGRFPFPTEASRPALAGSASRGAISL